jgi:hypothetical protein
MPATLRESIYVIGQPHFHRLIREFRIEDDTRGRVYARLKFCPAAGDTNMTFRRKRHCCHQTILLVWLALTVTALHRLCFLMFYLGIDRRVSHQNAIAEA